MLKINKSNYHIYKKVFTLLWEFEARIAGIDPNVSYSPVKVLNEWENENFSKAVKGLREGLRDTLTQFSDLPENFKNDLNQNLMNKELPGLNTLIAEIKNIPAKVLKKGRIKDLDEYYIIKEVLDNMDNDLSDFDRSRLLTIFGEYELGE